MSQVSCSALSILPMKILTIFLAGNLTIAISPSFNSLLAFSLHFPSSSHVSSSPFVLESVEEEIKSIEVSNSPLLPLSISLTTIPFPGVKAMRVAQRGIALDVLLQRASFSLISKDSVHDATPELLLPASFSSGISEMTLSGQNGTMPSFLNLEMILDFDLIPTFSKTHRNL